MALSSNRQLLATGDVNSKIYVWHFALEQRAALWAEPVYSLREGKSFIGTGRIEQL